MSPSVYSRNLNPSSLNAYHYCFKRPFGMFFMQLKGFWCLISMTRGAQGSPISTCIFQICLFEIFINPIDSFINLVLTKLMHAIESILSHNTNILHLHFIP